MSASRVLFAFAVFLTFVPVASMLFDGGDAAVSNLWYIAPAAVLLACGVLASRSGVEHGVGRIGLLVGLMVTAVVGCLSWKLMIDQVRTRVRAEPAIDRLIQEHNAALPADSVVRISPGSPDNGMAPFLGALYCTVGFGMLLMAVLSPGAAQAGGSKAIA